MADYTAIRISDLDNVEIRVLPDSLNETAQIIQGRYGRHLRHIKGPRRILDVGCGEGQFTVWAHSIWPNAWLDCYETDPTKRRFCEFNIPPGAKLLSSLEEAAPAYDLIRLTYPLAKPPKSYYTIHDYLEITHGLV